MADCYRKGLYNNRNGIFMLSPLINIKQPDFNYEEKTTLYKQMRVVYRSKCLLYCATLAVLYFVLYITGLLAVIFWETSFSKFDWPLYIDTDKQVDLYIKEGMSRYPPYNSWNYPFLINPRKSLGLCLNPEDTTNPYPVYLRIMIKSKAEHFENRKLIRKLWTKPASVPERKVEFVFLIGRSLDRAVNKYVSLESADFNDILLTDVLDTYYNNTLKTMMAFEWLFLCPDYEFVFFVDDDFYINITNILQYLSDKKGDTSLYTGYRFDTSPFRSPLFKHYVPLSQYAFSRYPPYIAAGAYLLSRSSASRLCIASRYVRKYRFDDVYLGIIAYKLGLNVEHNDKFQFWSPGIFQNGDTSNMFAIHADADLKLMKQLSMHKT